MRTKVEHIVCDICQYGDPYTSPDDFEKEPRSVETRSGTAKVDLCRWCAEPGPFPREMSTAGHIVQPDDDAGWKCSCGATFEKEAKALGLMGVAAIALRAADDPKLTLATMHLNRALPF